MNWLEVHIDTTHAGLDTVEATLSALGIDGVVIDDETEFQDFLENNHQYWDYVDENLEKDMAGKSRITFYLEANDDGFAALGRVRMALQALKEERSDCGTLLMTLSDLKNEDWENNWKQYYQPLPIGEKLLVVPQWLSPENEEGRIPVILDPGMIFGTGAHASTQMCMRALEKIVRGGESVIDLGSGSGILSITALLLGVKSALGVDIDPKAEDIARENAAMNGLHTDRFTAVTGDVIGDKAMMEKLSQPKYDIVLANIVADVIIPLSEVVPAFLKKDGVFICSGILDVRLDEVKAALQKNGLTITEEEMQDDWCRLTAALA